MTTAMTPPHHRLGIRCDHWLEVMDELNIGAFVADGSRRITAINLSAQALLGLRELEVVDRDCREVFTGVPCTVECVMHHPDTAGNRDPDMEVTDEENRRHLITRMATPIYNRRGEIEGCMTILQDHSPITQLIDRLHYEERSLKVILDNLDHACILDGARLSFGRVLKYKHNDMESLEERLRSVEEEWGRMIVVDGVFSMEGDVANLPRIVELKKQYGARLMVDDAHGIGVMGENGRGTAEHFGVESDADLVMGTFSKSLAAVGGFIVGDRPVIDWVKHHARSLMFSASPPPASVATVIKAVEIIEREPERRQRLWEHTRYMKREFANLGFDTGDSASPVIPVVVGEDMTAFKMTIRLQQEGVFANPVITPAVPPNRAMIRTSYMATHTRDQLDQALEAFAKVGRELGVIA